MSSAPMADDEEKWGTQSQGEQGGVSDRKLVRGNTRGEGGSGQTDLTGFLPKAGQGVHVPWGKVEEAVREEFGQILSMVRYGKWGTLVTLT